MSRRVKRVELSEVNYSSIESLHQEGEQPLNRIDTIHPDLIIDEKIDPHY